MIILPVEDTVEKDVDIRKHDKLGILALEMAIIKNNIEDYPDIQTTEDLFNAMSVFNNNQTDFMFAKIIREILDYDEEENEEEIPKEKLKEMFVEIPTKGLYAKTEIEDENYKVVYQIAFLKSSYYIPEKSDGMKIIPFLGKVVAGKDFEGNGLNAPWLVTCKAIKAHKNIDGLKKFLMLSGDSDPFVCGDFLYSIKSGNLGQHGELTAENVEALRKGV